MSEEIKHECGIGLIRLLKPLEHYQEKYGSPLWGLNKMYLLMEKQRNRGQDGAGLGVVKLNTPPGVPYHARARAVESPPLNTLFKNVGDALEDLKTKFPKEKYHDEWNSVEFLKKNYEYAGEVMLAHLRYGTHSANGIAACHPVSRINNWKNRSLLLAGNFNMTNVGELIQTLIDLGQHPRHLTDTETILEKIGHFLDMENEALYQKLKSEHYADTEIARLIDEELDMLSVFKKSVKYWDGGYVIGGIVGNGDAFIARDPNGIRPCYYYYNEEMFVAASERATISTVFNLPPHEIQELSPAHLITVKGCSGKIDIRPFAEVRERKSCSFERIYFSRGSDVKIYQERKNLGKHIVPQVLEAIDYDLDNTVFSFIPNTAEVAFQGLVEGMQEYLDGEKVKAIQNIGEKTDFAALQHLIGQRPRVEKAVIKDVKMRTFIADDDSRDDLVAHVYDVTPGILNGDYTDNLVCIDDSIVRGTTLKQSILNMLARLNPKKIVIVSSAPQIRYPDCYGIDMSQIHKLIAFRAAIALLEERNMDYLIHEVYGKIQRLKSEKRMESENVVKEIYAPFTEEEISAKIAQMLTPKGFHIPVEIVYQPLENLAKAIPNHRGDWYFSGDYPTPGGTRVSNQAFLNYHEKLDVRAYQAMF
ncbi:MAG: amidophosphoribosyltransferase [Bacteroidia bacterium]